MTMRDRDDRARRIKDANPLRLERRRKAREECDGKQSMMETRESSLGVRD